MGHDNAGASSGQARLPASAAPPSRLLRNAWYVAAWGEELVAGKLLARTILGQPVVLFRTAAGKAAALVDRCPHRFAPLSMGKRIDGDRIQCAYHGLEIDAAGTCVRNPHPPGNIPSRARVRAFPIVERHWAVWIWMGEAGAADPARIPDFSVLDDVAPLHATKLDSIRIAAGYELIVDNLLDLSHTAYLHEGLLGNADIVESEIVTEVDGEDVIVDRFSKNAAIPGMSALQWPGHPPRVDKFTNIRWMAPSTLRLDVGVCMPGEPRSTGTGYHAIHLLTPETDSTTHYFFTAVRFGVRTSDEATNLEIQDKIAAMRRFAFLEQDAPVIEAQQRAIDMAGEPIEPLTLSIDGGPVRYKRVLDRLLQEQHK